MLPARGHGSADTLLSAPARPISSLDDARQAHLAAAELPASPAARSGRSRGLPRPRLAGWLAGWLAVEETAREPATV